MVQRQLLLSVRGLNTVTAYEELLDFLKEQDILSNSFLYRGTGILEISWLEGSVKRPSGMYPDELLDEDEKVDESLISLYTAEDLVDIVNGRLEVTNPVAYAQQFLIPIIAVYKSSYFIKDDQATNSLSDFNYRFKDLDKRKDSLQNYIILKD